MRYLGYSWALSTEDVLVKSIYTPVILAGFTVSRCSYKYKIQAYNSSLGITKQSWLDFAMNAKSAKQNSRLLENAYNLRLLTIISEDNCTNVDFQDHMPVQKRVPVS